MSKTKKDYIFNLSWSLLLNLVRVIGGALIGIQVANYLDPADYGKLGYVVAFSSIFLFLAQLGLDSIVIKKLIEYPQKKGVYLGSALFLQAIGAIIAVLLTNSVSYLLVDEMQVRIFILVISSQYIFNISNSFRYYFKSEVKDKYNVIAQILAFAISSSLKLIFISQNLDLSFFIYAYVVDFCVSALTVTLFFFNKSSFEDRIRINKGNSLELLSQSWIVAFAVFLTYLLIQTDKLMIKEFLSFDELGIYNTATDLAMPISFIPQILGASILPYLLEIYKNDKSFYDKRFIQIMSIAFWTSILLSTTIFFIAEPLLTFFYKPEYSEALIPLQIIIYRLAFLMQLLLIGNWLLIKDKLKFRLIISATLALSNIILNFVLINNYGINGAAFSTLISYLIAIFILPNFIGSLRDLRTSIYKSLNPIQIIRFLSKG
jgi:O-antigen/teichoic acid export membrane protein